MSRDLRGHHQRNAVDRTAVQHNSLTSDHPLREVTQNRETGAKQELSHSKTWQTPGSAHEVCLPRCCNLKSKHDSTTARQSCVGHHSAPHLLHTCWLQGAAAMARRKRGAEDSASDDSDDRRADRRDLKRSRQPPRTLDDSPAAEQAPAGRRELRSRGGAGQTGHPQQHQQQHQAGGKQGPDGVSACSAA